MLKSVQYTESREKGKEEETMSIVRVHLNQLRNIDIADLIKKETGSESSAVAYWTGRTICHDFDQNYSARIISGSETFEQLLKQLFRTYQPTTSEQRETYNTISDKLAQERYPDQFNMLYVIGEHGRVLEQSGRQHCLIRDTITPRHLQQEGGGFLLDMNHHYYSEEAARGV